MHVKTPIRNFIRCLCFLIVFSTGLQFISDSFMRKTLNGSWNYTVKIRGFYKQEPQSIEILGIGSSHMYCTMVPNEIWKAAGINSYVLSTQEQTLEMSYYLLVEALKTQHPEVVVLETYMFNYDSSEFNDAAASNAIESFPLSMNKARFIADVVPYDVQLEYFFPILKYHSTWTTIDDKALQERYQGQVDPFRGYVYLNETHNAPDYDVSIPAQDIPINPNELIILQDILELTQKENIALVLLHAPTDMSEISLANQTYLKQYAYEQQIPYLNLNEHLNEMGILPLEDFFDSGHLNINGARKASQYLVSYLEETYTFEKKYSEVTLEELEKANQNYIDILTK